MTVSAHSLRIIEKSLAELDALLQSGHLSPTAQQQGEKTSSDMHVMIFQAKARPPCCCGECDVDTEAP